MEHENLIGERGGSLAALKSQTELIEERKKKVVGFLRQRYDWIIYALLGVVVFLAVRIRTRNLPGLKDITTGTWTLGPDLDPFFFLRLAKYIVEQGSLMAVDMMRYVPLGFNVAMEDNFIFHYYSIAWFHKIFSVFGSESVTYSAIIYPVFMFALTVISFFLLVRTIFADSLGIKKANAIALVSSFFLSVMPSLLPRTIAGIPEKESAAFFYMFMAFYFFLRAWKSKTDYSGYGLAILSGLATAGMALIWGGYLFIFVILVPTLFIAFLFDKFDRRKFYISLLGVAISFATMNFFAEGYYWGNLIKSTTTGGFVFILFIVFVDLLCFKTKLKKYFTAGKIKNIPPKIISLLVSLVIVVLFSSAIFGISFLPDQLKDLKNNLIKPATSRLIQTVAENKQPYFTEWASNFGPFVKGIPLTFWLFFIGSIYLFNYMTGLFKKKERIYLTAAYSIFLISLVFSRYSPSKLLNGENFISIFFYALGFLIFIGTFGFYYYKYFKNNELDKLRSIDLNIIFVFMFFFLAIISARGAVRLIMILVPPASIIVSYLAVSSYELIARNWNKEKKIFVLVLSGAVILLTIFSGYNLYKGVSSESAGYVPSGYTQQWQKAMQWVREETPENSVFGHWWDYGYWVQSIGERATVLDGGNEFSYWNHLMGRYALTGTSNIEALEFLYAHNTTHFLIDSTDIGKYTAFSSIGSDENYDRRSWIPTFLRDNSQTVERKNSTLFIYSGGIAIDEDILYEENGTRIFLPGDKAGLGAVIIEKNSAGEISSVLGVFVYQNQQYTLPLRYYYDGKLNDLGRGLESGIFLHPKINVQDGQGINIEQDGALLYLSKRTVKSQLARLYLYGEENNNFKEALVEDDFIIKDLKSQGVQIGSFAYFQGFRGPIKIWGIEYPKEIKYKKEFIDTDYPESLRVA